MSDALRAVGRVKAVLDEIDAGEHATTGRQFGQGMAHAAKLVRAALETEPVETRVWIVETPRDSDKGERSSKHIIEWVASRRGYAYVDDRPGEDRRIRVMDTGVMHPGDSITHDGRIFTIKKAP